jgi:hypothetical protein
VPAPPSETTTARHLAYTVALDPAKSFGQRLLGKLLGSSLLRTWFSGDVVIFRNTPEPLFAVERAGLSEVFIETPDFQALADQQEAWRYKFRVREYLDVSGYDKVLFLDADCLALRNLDHLLEGDWDIRWYPESRKLTDSVFNCFLTDEEIHRWRDRPGANSGTLAVRAEVFHDVMAEWERIDLGPTTRTRFCSDQGSWNRLLLDTKLRTKRFERGEIQFPLCLHPSFHDWKKAALVHAIGGTLREKMRFLWGLYMQTFYYDDRGTMLNLLEV